ncbi:MAG: cytochrome c [Bacilli bacterium]|nr:cytochrome c [Bacilli bacterium]
MLKKMLVLTIGIIVAFSVSACGNKTTSPSPAPTGTPPSGNNAGTVSPGAGNASPGTPGSASPGAGTATVDAQAVFKQNCISCHGVNLEGGVGPNLQKVGSRLSADQIATTITNGRKVMPSFKGTLKPEEISALSVWLAAKK